MIIHNPILTGSFTVNGTDVSSITSSAASLTSLNAYTASQNNRNGTYATTGSNTFAGIQTVNSNLVVTGSITAQTLVVQTITSSVDFVTGSTRFGSVIGNTHVFTGSVSISGSLTSTSATFDSSVSRMMLINSTNTNGPYVALQVNGSDEFYIGKSNGVGGGAGFYDIYANAAGGGLRFYTSGSASPSLTIASTGAATFSSTVDATRFNGNLLVGSATVGGNIQLNYGANAASRSWRFYSDAYNFGDFAIQQSTTQTGSTYVNKIILSANGDLTIGAIPSTGIGSIYAGAATFSSTVQSTRYFNTFQNALNNSRNSFQSYNLNETTLTVGWIAGDFGDRGTTSARVVMGSGFNNKAIIGGHTGTLDAWADLLLNPGGGSVLVGTTAAETSALAALAPSTTTAAIQGRNPNSTTAPIIQASSVTVGSTSWYAYVAQSGNGSSVTANTMFVYGNGNIVNLNNSYGTLSDIKLKENIVDATPKLANIMQLKVRNFNLIADELKTKQIGFIAQELEKVFPGIVEEVPDRDIENNDLGTVTKTIKTSVLVPMLVKAIQELKAEIDELKNN